MCRYFKEAYFDSVGYAEGFEIPDSCEHSKCSGITISHLPIEGREKVAFERINDYNLLNKDGKCPYFELLKMNFSYRAVNRAYENEVTAKIVEDYLKNHLKLNEEMKERIKALSHFPTPQ